MPKHRIELVIVTQDNKQTNPKVMFPDIVKQPREPGKYRLSEVQCHRKHGQVGIYRLVDECEDCPSYLVLNWFQANNYKITQN